MNYIVADIRKAKDLGFQELGHIVKGKLICLNEKEVMNNPAMQGTLEDRADVLGSVVSSASEAKQIMNNSN